MYQVIGARASRTARVLWALEEMGLDYEFLQHNPRSDEVRELNPTGKVPVLRDGDAVLTDSSAIITYLADKHGMMTAPAGTIERARQDAMTFFLLDEFDACLWTAARNSFILPEEMRVPAIKATLKWEFTRAQAELVRRMPDAPFLMGEQMTIPDIIAGHCGSWARNASFEITEPVYDDYLDRMLARPGWKMARGL